MQSAHVGHQNVVPRGVKRQSVRRFVRCQSSNGNGARNVVRETTISRLIRELDTVAVPGCYDALSAKLLSKTGHHAGFVSGYAVSASLLGEPDIGLLSAPEMATATRHICEAVPNFPIIADADTGGGNTANVERTVKQLISAGAKGCVLEDQVWPKKLGHMKAHEVTSIDEFVAKIAAAREAIGDTDFFLIARTDSRSLSAKNGLVDAIVRVNVYADAGADAVLVEAPRSTYELKQIASNTHGFRAVNMLEGGGITPLHSVEDLKAMGFHLVMYPLAGVFSAAKALQNVYGMLQQTGSTCGALDSMLSFEEFGGVVDFNSKLESEQQQLRVLTQDKLHVRIRAPTHPAPLS